MVTAWNGLTGFLGATGLASGSDFPKSSFARFKTSIDTMATPIFGRPEPNLPRPAGQ